MGKMLKLLALAVCLAAVCAQQQQHQQGHHDPMMMLVHHEVVALKHGDSSLTSASCITKCDAAMEMDDPNDESHIDDLCKHMCECEIDQNCPNGQHTPPQHQHMTHP